MAATFLDDALAQFPADLVGAVVAGAARDADFVVHFLRAAGLTPPPGKVAFFHSAFLLNLGAASRLIAWEEAGLSIHREAGLPPALEAVQQVCAEANPRCRRKRRLTPWLLEAVIRLAIDRLAWAGQRELSAEIVLNVPDEDALVEAMAQLLWDCRRLSPSLNGGPVQ